MSVTVASLQPTLTRKIHVRASFPTFKISLIYAAHCTSSLLKIIAGFRDFNYTRKEHVFLQKKLAYICLKLTILSDKYLYIVSSRRTTILAVLRRDMMETDLSKHENSNFVTELCRNHYFVQLCSVSNR